MTFRTHRVEIIKCLTILLVLVCYCQCTDIIKAALRNEEMLQRGRESGVHFATSRLEHTNMFYRRRAALNHFGLFGILCLVGISVNNNNRLVGQIMNSIISLISTSQVPQTNGGRIVTAIKQRGRMCDLHGEQNKACVVSPKNFRQLLLMLSLKLRIEQWHARR